MPKNRIHESAETNLLMEKTILYIEDDIDNQTLVRLFLRNEPYDLITAETPQQALDVISSRDVDIIIVDLNLQEEGDGVELIRSIRGKNGYETVPIFVFSGFDEQHFKKYGIETLIQYFFRKPTSKKDLIEALNNVGGKEVNQT